MGKIIAINISPQRGTEKHTVPSARLVADWGIQEDAHAGHWHRQVSLLSAERFFAFRDKGAPIEYGAFGENLLVEGFDFTALPVGTRFRCGDVLLQMTQIGKDCHSHCAIFQRMGECIMPHQGVFTRVLEGGEIHVGDEMTIEMPENPLPWQAAVITLSDKGAAGQREDKSGPAIANRLRENGYEVVEQLLLADEPEQLKKQLRRLCDQRQLDLILTTGGTGFAPRDRTPEATLAVAERNAPGIAEAIRAYSMAITPRAMLSRGVSVIRGKTLIINLPGSPKACMESMDAIMDTLPHGLELLRGQGGECARKEEKKP